MHAAQRLRPGQHFGACRVAAFRTQRSRNVADRVGMRAQSRPPAARMAAAGVCRLPIEATTEKTVEGVLKMLSRHVSSSRDHPASMASDSRVSAIRSSIPAIHCGSRHRTGDHLPAGVAEHDQMTSEIAAVHRGDIFRLQRTQVARVVPVVEMPAETLEPIHGPERRLQPLDRFDACPVQPKSWAATTDRR